MSDAKANDDALENTPNDALQVVEDTSLSSTENKAEKKRQQERLTPDEFRFVLKRIDDLGLTWTADVPPLIKPKVGASRQGLFSEEYSRIKQDYPNFPRELTSVVFYALTGSGRASSRLGREEDLEQKVAAVQEYIINTEYRSEFFFKYAIKIPYFSDLDWEVVIKTHEKNVNQSPRIAYALLSFIFRQPVNPTHPASIANEFTETEMLTVAVDEYLVDKLIKSLSEVKDALKESRGLTDSLGTKSLIKEDENGVDS